MERVIAYVDDCGRTYTTFHEKMTDVNISVEMMTDATHNRLDTALLISADSDLTGLLNSVRSVFKKKVIVAFPPKRSSNDLIQACAAAQSSAHYLITRNAADFSASPLPVIGPSEFLRLMAAG